MTSQDDSSSQGAVRRQLRLRGSGIELSVHEYVAPSQPASGLTLLCLHGYLDVGDSWQDVGRRLAAAGHRVLAPDLRGYGQTDGVGAGGYYHFPDYLADVTALVERIQPQRLVLVGHSMGGTIACLYAGAFPERVEAMVLLEGLGPPAMPVELALTRTRRWLADLERMHGQSRGPYGAPLGPPGPSDRKTDRNALSSVEDAARRLGAHHPGVPTAVIDRQAALLTCTDAAGRLVWAHDPLHRTTSPARFDVEAFKLFLAAIPCPVLFLSGGKLGWHPEDEDDRLAAITGPTERAELPDAGHMMHWTQPAAVAAVIARFLEARLATGRRELGADGQGTPPAGSTSDPLNWPA